MPMKININIWLRIPRTVIMYNTRKADLKIFKLKKFRVITELLVSILHKELVNKHLKIIFGDP